MHRFAYLALCSLLCPALAAFPQEPGPAAALPGATPSPILVELFTSEGCSDCPPADALLRQLYNTRTALGQPIVVLSEHVTYWDRLGWKDPFSDPAFTYRQEGYSSRFGLDSAYTPQIVLNGTRQFVGNNAKTLRDALLSEAPHAPVGLRILSAVRQADALLVHFSAHDLPGSTPLDIVAAITDDHDESRVERGENGGRTLNHVAVVRALTRVAQISGETTDGTARISLPSALRATSDTPRHLILFAQQRNYGRVLGVVSQPLTSARQP